jgi:hypothetical protein
LYLAVVEVAAVVAVDFGAVGFLPGVGRGRGIGVVVVVMGDHCCRKLLETSPIFIHLSPYLHNQIMTHRMTNKPPIIGDSSLLGSRKRVLRDLFIKLSQTI